MFSIPYVKSLGIHVLLAIAFGITEFPLPGNSIPAKEMCVNVSGQNICYFTGSEKPEKWFEARELCRSFSSTLPVIRNRNDQDAVIGYLKSHMKNSVAWTAGQNFTYREWTWINGEPLKDSAQVQLQEDGVLENVNAALDMDFTFTALAASDELPYICQYEGAYCNSSSDIIVSGKCLRLISDKRTWYDARNQCFMSNGDLAIISDDVHGHLKEWLTRNQSYWIGLRKKSWRWNLSDNGLAESNHEIKYTNWYSNSFSTIGECISIDATNGKWKAVGCTENQRVVCQRAVSGESTTLGLQSSTPQSLLISVVIVGISVIVILSIIVALVVRKYVYHRSSEKTENGRYQDLETTRRQANPDCTYTELQLQPVYEEVSQRGN